MELRPRAEKGGHSSDSFQCTSSACSVQHGHNSTGPVQKPPPSTIVFFSFIPFYDGNTRPSPTRWDSPKKVARNAIRPISVPHSAHKRGAPAAPTSPSRNEWPADVFLPNRPENASEWRTHAQRRKLRPPRFRRDSSILLPPSLCPTKLQRSSQEIEF